MQVKCNDPLFQYLLLMWSLLYLYLLLYIICIIGAICWLPPLNSLVCYLTLFSQLFWHHFLCTCIPVFISFCTSITNKIQFCVIKNIPILEDEHPILYDNKYIPIMEDKKHPNLDGNKSIPILDGKKHLILDDNKYIPILDEEKHPN